MLSADFALVTLAVSFAAGIIGSMLGLGGGVLIVPFLTLYLGVDIRYGIGASAIAVIATSSGAAVAHLKERMTNQRIAMLLQVATTSGALVGAHVNGLLPARWLYLTFGLVLTASALAMMRKRTPADRVPLPDPWAERLRLGGTYRDEALGQQITYRASRTPLAFLLMLIAGAVSGLLGIGSGVLKVPAMDLAMRLPIKVSTATSNFMIGVTAAAGAAVYFARGDVNPSVAAPVVVGVLAGAAIGSRLMPRMDRVVLRWIFVVVVFVVAVQMLWEGLR